MHCKGEIYLGIYYEKIYYDYHFYYYSNTFKLTNLLIIVITFQTVHIFIALIATTYGANDNYTSCQKD